MAETELYIFENAGMSIMRYHVILLLVLFVMPMVPVTANHADRAITSPMVLSALSDGKVDHSWTVEFVLVNYDANVIDTNLMTTNLPHTRDYTTADVHIHYDITYNFHYANVTWSAALEQVMLTNSVNSSETGTWLNETALVYQKEHPDEPQRIFYPRAGRSIDADVVEQWLLDHPYVTPPKMGYIFYLLNFSKFDSTDHALEHWFDYHPIDPDSGRLQDFFRLEWDNDLNAGVKFEFAGFGGKRGNIYVLDPSADEWYLKWARIWWNDPPYSNCPLSTFMDMDSYVQTLDLTTPSDAAKLVSYIAGYVYDPVSYLFFPTLHSPTKYVSNGRLRALVFDMDVKNGVSVDSLRWVTNAKMQQEHLTQLIPFINWTVDVDYLDIDSYTDWKTLFWSHASTSGGLTVADGGSMFDAIYTQMRPHYVTGASNTAEVFGVVFIKKNMVMEYAGHYFTGLGGGGQTVIWKSWERYYLSDGVTPKAGVSVIQLHESMHAIGFGHTWSTPHYAGDFSSSPMGYFSFHNGTSVYDQNWAQSTYLDQMIVKVAKDLETTWNSVSDENETRAWTAYQTASKYLNHGLSALNSMDWSAAYQLLLKAKMWTDIIPITKQDSTPPSIVSWDMISDNSVYDDFVIQVQVTDADSSVLSVEIQLTVDSVVVTKNCTFENGRWVASFDALSTSVHSVTMLITALDRGLNEASLSATLVSDGATGVPSPPLQLEFILIIGSIAAVICVVIIILHRRRRLV
ncbi:MAG: hypothetical protein K9W43_10515 [Candidatus Thorarchaeota archaeon]|nr:hypothetical protein [Candidatus Thorarchaeota archaeon]